MRYLLDTDITSYFLRGKYNLDLKFEEKGIPSIRLSIVSVAEMKVLAYRHSQKSFTLSKIERLAEQLGVVKVDCETWEFFSKMKAQTLQKGSRRGDFDILNAALARQHNLIMVTNNVRHYQDIVETENWVS